MVVDISAAETLPYISEGFRGDMKIWLSNVATSLYERNTLV